MIQDAYEKGRMKLIQNIQALLNDPEQFDEDEQPPSCHVVEQLVELVGHIAPSLADTGLASCFYGKVSVTWQSDAKVVLVACFPNHPALLVTGDRRQPVGSFKEVKNPTADDISAALRDLSAHHP